MKACAACNQEYPESFRLCPMCGAVLDSPPEVRHEERKVVTVLFCDLVGFTSRSESMDVEDVRQTLVPYHDLLRHVLEGYGGTVEKFIGDAVMALFGAPVAHEDDAERAVRAALAIAESVARLRQDDPWLDLHVRIGVNTGEALVALGADPGRGEGMATGDVVNTAARLQSAAPVDGILVGEGTHRATNRVIHLTAGDPITAKGKAEPVPVWIVEGARAIVAEDETDAALGLVGRAQERNVLLSALERTRSEGSVQLVTVVGAPGIGKSRLIAELSLQIDSEVELTTWRRGRSLAYGEGVAFWALGEIVKAEAGILESDQSEVAADKLHQTVTAILDAADADWIEAQLRPLVGLDAGATAAEGEAGRMRAFAAWRRFCEAIAEQHPAVFVFEDLHWADDALLDFVDHLADRAIDVPLLVVGTARPELLERRPAWGGGKPNATTVSLSPLSQADTARLIGDLLGQALLPAELQAALLERAEGNPLYAMEYVHMLRDEGALERTPSGWRFVEGAGRGHLPASVQGIIAARLDGLAPVEKRLMGDAAVLGRTGWVGAVAVVGGIPAHEADELVHQLARKQLLRRARHSSVAGDDEWSFTHALTQEVAYGQIPRLQRAEKHLRVAEWIERLAGGREDKAELLAHHYRSALELRRELGRETADIEPRARRAFAEAGRQAAAAYAHVAAIEHFTAALELTGADDPDRPALLLDRATETYQNASMDEPALRATLAAQTDAESAAWAEYLLYEWALQVAGDGDQADLHIGRAGAISASLPLTIRTAVIERARVFRAFIKGMMVEASAIATAAMERAEREQLDEVRGMLMAWHGNVRLEAGDIDGLAEMEAAATILARHANTTTWTTYCNIADVVRGCGDLARAEQHSAEGLRWAELLGTTHGVATLSSELANLAYHAGRWGDALEITATLLGIPDTINALAARCVRGWIELARDGGAVSAADATAIVDYARNALHTEMLFYGLALRAATSVAAGDDGAAQTACDTLLVEWTRVGGMQGRLENLAEIAPILVGHGLHAELEEAARLVKTPSRWTDALVAIAERRCADAAGIYADMGTLPHAAAAHMLAAAETRSAAAAAQHLAAARRFYESVGAVAYLRRAESHALREAT